MYRLLSNLDFMRGMDSSEGTLFRPVTLDLVGPCRRLTEEAAFLLREAGVQLRFQCRLASLLIPGDPALLQKLLLTLISNGAKAAHPGELVLTLERRGNQAVLRLGDRGEGRCLDDLFPPKEAEARIPAPGDGAGMGLAIARHIVELHQGTLLLGERGGGGVLALVSLPTGPLRMDLAVCTPAPEPAGGISPVLMELADVLPLSLFHLDE